MKYIMVQVQSEADISSMLVGTTVNVTKDEVSVSGIVFATAEAADPPEPTLIPHTHPIAGSGTVQVTGAAGPAIESE